MAKTGTFYQEAAQLLCIASSKTTSLRNAYFNQKSTKSKAVYALVAKCLRVQSVIIAALKEVGALKGNTSHIKSPKSNACTACLLSIAAFDVSCPRRSFGSRRDALKLLQQHGPSHNIASSLRRIIKSGVKSANANETITQKIPVYARVIAPMDKVIETLSDGESFSQISYDHGVTSYKKFIKLVKELKIGEFIRDYHFPYLLLLFAPGTDLHLSPIITSKLAVVQDKASCLPPLVLLDAISLLQLPSIKILDACAAPGNKTTLLLSGLKDFSQCSEVIALDRDRRRFDQLCKNLKGFDKDISYVNGEVKNPEAKSNIACDARLCDFLNIDPMIDEDFSDVTAIIVDPTCTGSGLRSKCPELVAESEDQEETSRVERLASLQAKILRHALSFPSVLSVVYSTCSVYQQENEGVIIDVINSGAANDFELLSVWKKRNKRQDNDTPVSRFTPQARWKSRGRIEGTEEEDDVNQLMSRCLRSSTERDLTIGFFVACFKRKE
nr:methyltransferase nsun5 [Hymenolepis microstoma]